MRRASFKLLATAVALFCTVQRTLAATNAAHFVAKDNSVAFALNIPNDDDNDKDDPSTSLNLAISGPSSSSWIAIGMGYDKMDDSLMFMVYAEKSGKNITISPRLSYGHVEPSYTSSVNYTLGPGSGIFSGTITAVFRCQNCRSWKGGSINANDTHTPFIFASGPKDTLKSNSKSADIERHATYGIFYMDLTQAVGEDAFASVAANSSSGTKPGDISSDNDISVPLHGTLMVVAFVGLMPLGIVILRILGNFKWHSLNQTVSAAIAIVGLVLGIYCSAEYNRSKDFISGHQLFGFVVIAAMVAQFLIGFIHHRRFKKRIRPTGLNNYHIWLGQLSYLAWTGFPLALHPTQDLYLFSATLSFGAALAVYSWWKLKQRPRKQQDEQQKLRPNSLRDPETDTSRPSTQPWNTPDQSESDMHLDDLAEERYRSPRIPGSGELGGL